MKSKVIFSLIVLSLVASLFSTSAFAYGTACGGGCTAYPYINGCIEACLVNGQNAYKFYIENTGSARTYEVFLSCHYSDGSVKWVAPGVGFSTTVAPLFAGLVTPGRHLVATLTWGNFLYLGEEQHFRFDRTVNGICGNICDSGL